MSLQIASKKLKIPKVKLLTYEDYARLTPPDSGNYELHNGQIIYMASPAAEHQRISRKLVRKLDNYIEGKNLGELFYATLDTSFTIHDTFQPDILFIDKSRLHIIKRIIEGAPDLVVEILSPGNPAKEMSYKKYIFEATGVREYWLVNPDNQTVSQYENIGGELLRLHILGENNTLQSITVEGFELPVKAIFD